MIGGTGVLMRLIGRAIERRLLPSALVVIGVAVGVAVVIAIDLANNSAGRAFALSAESVTGRATHQVISGVSGLPSEVYRAIRVDLGIRDAAPVVETTIRVLEVGDRALRVLGVDPFAEPPFRDYLSDVSVSDGSGSQAAFDALTAFITRPGTAVISDRLASLYDLTPGSTLTAQLLTRDQTLTIVGVLETTDSVGASALDNLILTDVATAQDLSGLTGRLSRIDMILPTDYDLALITALLPEGASITTPRAQSDAIGQMTAAFELNLQALSLLALVVGMFLIYNTISFSVVQRRAQLGIMRSLGATRRQIFALILGEALVLGVIGTIFGVGLGMIFGRATVGLVAQTISDLYFAVDVQGVTIDAVTILKGIGIGILASLAAAVVPAIDATRTPPAGSMRRSSIEQTAERLVMPITWTALALIVTGGLLLTVPTTSLIISFAALFCVIVGGALMTPMLLVLFMRAALPVTDALFGVIGRMAARSVGRALSRTSVATAALTVAVSVIVGVSLMIGSFRETVADWLDTTLGADIYVSPPQLTATRIDADVDPALPDRVRPLAGVERLVVGRNVRVTAPDYPTLPPVNLNVSDGELVSRERRFVWRTAGDDYMATLQAGAIMVSEPFAFRRGITPDANRLTLLTDRGEQTFEIVGVYYDYATDQGAVFMHMETYRAYFDDPFISTFSVFTTADADEDAVLASMREALSGTDLIVQSNRALRASVFEVFERTFAITGALRLLAVIVAFIGILSALMALQLERTREFGVMRAVGMTQGGLWRYTLIQTGLLGLVAGLIALPIGAALAAILIYVINVRSFGWTMQLALTPEEFAIALLVAVTAALLAGVYPAGRLASLVTARALRSE